MSLALSVEMGKRLEKCQGSSYRKLKMGVILYNCEIAWKAVSCGNKKDEKM